MIGFMCLGGVQDGGQRERRKSEVDEYPSGN